MTHPIAPHGHVHRLAHAILVQASSSGYDDSVAEVMLPAIIELSREDLTYLVFSIAGLAASWIHRCERAGIDVDDLMQRIGLVIAAATEP
jgi:hypothetical protein